MLRVSILGEGAGLRHLGEPIDISLEALVRRDLPLKGVIHKGSGRAIQHSYDLLHIHPCPRC
jgi:hypothetical protein